MPPVPYIPGYLGYLAALFLPGVGIGELLDFWPKGSTLGERFGYAFGIGLSFDTLVMLVKTSGLSVAGLSLRGIDLAAVYFLIGFGLASIFLSVAWRRRLRFATKPARVDLLLLFLIGVLCVIESVYFMKYPIFPQYESIDFGAHVQYVHALIAGATTSIPSGILYFGVHYQLATALLLVGGEPLVTLQRTMALLVALSPLVFYLAAKSLFSRRLAALTVATLYVFSGTVWFSGVFNSGLFPNFFGILAALFLIVAAARVASAVRSPKAWVVFVLALVMAYFSHYTIVTLIPSLLVLPVLQYFRDRKQTLAYLAPAAAAVAPGLVGLAFFPSLLSKALHLAVRGGGVLSGSTALSSALSGLPVLEYTALEVYDDVGFFFLILFALVYAYRGYRSKNVMIWLPLAWLASLLVAAPRDLSAWRFSYEAVIPLTFMAAYGVFSLLPKINRGSRRKRSGNYLGTFVVLVLLMSPMVLGSWTTTAVANATVETSVSAQAQESVYAAFYWLKANATPGAGILSATDWRFVYTPAVIGRTTNVAPSGGCYTNPHQVQEAALESNLTYIIVTRVVTCALPPSPQLYLWNTLKPATNLTLAYSNADVKIFQVVT